MFHYLFVADVFSLLLLPALILIQCKCTKKQTTQATPAAKPESKSPAQDRDPGLPPLENAGSKYASKIALQSADTDLHSNLHMSKFASDPALATARERKDEKKEEKKEERKEEKKEDKDEGVQTGKPQSLNMATGVPIRVKSEAFNAPGLPPTAGPKSNFAADQKSKVADNQARANADAHDKLKSNFALEKDTPPNVAENKEGNKVQSIVKSAQAK